MTKITTGKKLDDFQVENLANILTYHKAGSGNSISSEDLYRKLYDKFVEGNKTNTFYKKTPRVFTSLTVFYVQLAKAWVKAGFTYSSLWSLLTMFYNNTVLMYISPCPDVNMSEAYRILKTIKI